MARPSLVCPALRCAPRRSRRAKTEPSIAEAFAQQAYTAVGNRDRKIMKDPYLLGFEIVDKNEDNNRLVGVFAFRVAGEILMVPVFYLNGQIKGQDLIYRKPVNRFYPNTEKWVNYFVGRGQDETGRPVSRRSNADARIHMGIDRMSRMPGGYKSAGGPSVGRVAGVGGLGALAGGVIGGLAGYGGSELAGLSPDARRILERLTTIAGMGVGGVAAQSLDGQFDKSRWDEKGNKLPNESEKEASFEELWKVASAEERSEVIKAEWKEACAKTGFRPEHLDQFMFADFLVDHGLQKEAAELAGRIPWFADTIELGGLLDKPLTKRASAPKRSLEYHVDPPAGATEEQVAAHYARGFSFVDKRAAESLATAVKALADSPFEGSWSTLRKPGLNRVAGKDGTSRKVLWAPTTSDGDYPHAVGERHHKSNPGHRLVFLDGPDKGCVITYRNGCAETELPLFTDDSAVEKEASKGIFRSRLRLCSTSC